MRVALYIRVSTDEQAKSGYSIPEQRHTLREYAEREGYEVVEEITDDGYSSALPDRPGIRRVYELAEAGEIDAVVATKRDRFFRSRLLRLLMDRDMKEFGVTLVSLTDTGNRIGDGVQDDYAEWEHEQIAERTRNGKLSKARQGKVVGGHNRSYGFDYLRGFHKGKETITGYEINENEMSIVRHVFEDVASGVGIRTIKERLDSEHVPTPKGGPVWNRQFLRDMLVSDLYRPHGVDEVRDLGVSEDVLAGLDESSSYGVYKFEGIPVPVPDAGIPLETVLQARERLETHVPTRKQTVRVWELSGRVLRCAECGRAMQVHTTGYKDKKYHYYRCQAMTSGKADPCPNRTKVRADQIEPQVWNMVRGFVSDTEYVLTRLAEYFDNERRKLGRLSGGDMSSLSKRLAKIEQRWEKNKLAYEADAISIADLKARRSALDGEREALERELSLARDADSELVRLDEEERRARERIESGYGEGLENAGPEKRREVYRDTRLNVTVGADKSPQISGVFPMNFEGTPVMVELDSSGHGTYWERDSFGNGEGPPSGRYILRMRRRR